MHDIVIVGAGPAGLTAALYARRMGKTVLVLEKSTFGGQATFSPKIENYPGTIQMSGNEFADRLVEQVLAHGADIELENVTRVKVCGDVRTVYTEDGSPDCPQCDSCNGRAAPSTWSGTRKRFDRRGHFLLCGM